MDIVTTEHWLLQQAGKRAHFLVQRILPCVLCICLEATRLPVPRGKKPAECDAVPPLQMLLCCLSWNVSVVGQNAGAAERITAEQGSYVSSLAGWEEDLEREKD